MNTVFKDYGNDKRSDPHIILFNLTNKINLRISDIYITLPNLSIYYRWKNIKKSYMSSSVKWHFEWPGKSYSVLDIQGYLKNIIKTHETLTDNHQ